MRLGVVPQYPCKCVELKMELSRDCPGAAIRAGLYKKMVLKTSQYS